MSEVTTDIPRRICIDRLTPAETAIRNAVLAVEEAGAHPLLTDAVVLLEQAREKVADYVDLPPPSVEDALRAAHHALTTLSGLYAYDVPPGAEVSWRIDESETLRKLEAVMPPPPAEWKGGSPSVTAPRDPAKREAGPHG